MLVLFFRKIVAWAGARATFLLLAPLTVLMAFVFVLPTLQLTWRAVDNSEVTNALPRTLAALEQWVRKDELPPAAAYLGLVRDLTDSDRRRAGELGRRLESELPGSRNLIFKTARAMPLPQEVMADPDTVRTALIGIDARWGQTASWQVIANNNRRLTAHYLLKAVDLERTPEGLIVNVEKDKRLFRQVMARTFEIAVITSSLALVLAYPLAYWLAHLPGRWAGVALTGLFVPLWSSTMTRVTAWVVMLQHGGLVNDTLLALGLLEEPAHLLFTRAAVYVANLHILLPLMVFPLYGAMRSIPLDYERAARSLGSGALAAFWRVYFPHTRAAAATGFLLVFVTSVSYYITPMLVGGTNDLMASYYVAYFTNQVVDWALASALGLELLFAILGVFAVYRWIMKKVSV